MAVVTTRSDFGAPEEEICHYFHFSPSICHAVVGVDAMILVFLVSSLKPALSLSPSPSSRVFLVPLHFLPLEWYHPNIWGFSGNSESRVCLQCGRPRFNPWFRKILWRRKWQPTPVLLPGKSHGWRNLAGYISWVAKSWTRLNNFTSTYLRLWMFLLLMLIQLVAHPALHFSWCAQHIG